MDIARALGATEPAGTYPIAIFIPSVDRDGVPIDQAYWINEALAVLGRRFGGATAMPPGSGVWRDDDQGGELKSDESVMIFCLGFPEELEKFLALGACRRNPKIGIFWGGKALPRSPIVDPGAFCEVNF